jgi:thioredoxin-like negative regulator of GroEL
MTVKRFLLVFAVGVLLQASVFAVYYNDLLFLRQPVTLIAMGSRSTFTTHAVHALGRAKLTAQHLETIAGAAQAFHLPDLEIRALERRVQDDPVNESARLRLADALRRAGRYARAEQIYIELLNGSPKAGQ